MIARIAATFDWVDVRLVAFMRNHGIRLLRWALAVIFLWFGLLKVVGHSPVVALIAQTVYWVSPAWFIPVLGLWEMIVGMGLLCGRALRLTLLLFWLQLAGTFLVLILRPDIAFQGGHPLLLTMEGEFVMKNVVLITAGLVVGSTVPRHR